MLVHNITIFAKKSITPKFNFLSTDEKDIILRLHSGDSAGTPPSMIIFFTNSQEAIKFKNAVHQAWETHLREEAKKKS